MGGPIFKLLIVCGQQSLSIFCAGVFLSFAGHFFLLMSSGSLADQIFVSVSGIAIMILVASYISWSKRQDHAFSSQFARKPALQICEPALPAGDSAPPRLGGYSVMRASR